MSKEFEVIFDRVIGHEGKFTINEKDPGNWTGGKVGEGELKGTKFGLSAASYPDLDIANITYDQAKGLYWDWFRDCKLYMFRTPLQYQMFDAAFNHGLRKASQIFQRAVSVNDDGIIGSATRAAAAEMDVNDLLMRFIGKRLEFFTNLSHFDEFGRGWSRRIAKNLEYAAEDN